MATLDPQADQASDRGKTASHRPSWPGTSLDTAELHRTLKHCQWLAAAILFVTEIIALKVFSG